MLNRSTSLAMSTNVLKALPGKLDIKIHSPIIALKASGRDCTNNNELLHKIGVLQRYAMQLFVFTRELLQAIRWRSKYNGCTQIL